jgi:RNA polymerase sigma factor (sigma-70 family)
VIRDDALLSRLARGDGDAWLRLDRRYRTALRRYAASLCRPGTADPDDVVQDVLVRALRELQGGFTPDHLSAWLHRMVRNATIDALRHRAARPTEALGERAIADPGAAPDAVILRKDRLRRTVDDIARLPDTQRRAFIARAVDDRPVRDVACELGISERAVAMSVIRARENLLRTADARDERCDRIRPLLHDAHERGTRPAERARLHLQDCSACRTYRRDLRRVDRRLRGLVPPFLPLAGLFGGGAATVGVGAKSAAVVGAVALAIASGGAVMVHAHRSDPGQPAPATVDAEFVGRRQLRTGGALPPGTYAVSAAVRIPAGVPPPGTKRAVTLTCPPGTVTAQNLQVRHGAVPRALRSGATPGPAPGVGLGERRLTTRYSPVRLPHPVSFTTGVLCRRPDRAGSLVPNPRRARPGEVATTTTAGFHYLHHRAGGAVTGLLRGHEPVSVQRVSKDGRWARVAADAPHLRGWILTTALRSR